MTTCKLIHEDKKQLLSRLLEGVKGCQSRFGSRTELATEDDVSIRKLCLAFERVFLHGLQKPTSQSSKGIWQITETLVPAGLRSTEALSFWPLVKSQLSKHEAERFLLLHHVRSDLGRGRAWLRAALNEHSLERYILIVLSLDNLHLFYHDSAFLRDDELSSILPQTAAGLGSVLFALCVDNPGLDKVDQLMEHKVEEPIAESVPELAEVAEQALDFSPRTPTGKSSTHNSTSVQEAGSPVGSQSKTQTPRKPKKKKKIPTTFVSFDDPSNSEQASAPSSPHPTSISAQTEAREQDQSSPQLTKAKITASAKPESKSFDDNTVSSQLPTGKSGMVNEEPEPFLHQRSIVIDRLRSAEIEIYSVTSSIKSADSVSIYSDCSDRLDIDNLSLSGVSPSQRLKPVGSDLEYTSSGDQDKDRANDLIPVPNYSNDECESESNSQSGSVSGRAKDEESRSRRSGPPENELGGPDTITKLKTILEHEVEMVTKLKTQLAQEKRTSNDEIKILETRIETLSKENELLKHQLNKYIGAVQLLRESGRRASLDLDDIDVLSSNDVSKDEHSTEGVEYERKLIQVAEMHGELMEFNAYLQGLLQRKDNSIRRLQEELVDLRGPCVVPLEGTDGDSLSLDANPTIYTGRSSPFQRQISRNNERVLINIWIPSAFLTGATNDLHHVYQVFLRIKDTEWNVYRRYSQFNSLHRDLKKRDSVISSFDFPPKKHIGNKDSKFVDERRRKLQEYLRKVINHTLQTNSILASHPDKNLLISILPFFGEVTQHKPRRERSRSRSLFFRQSEPLQMSPASGHPQYTGL